MITSEQAAKRVSEARSYIFDTAERVDKEPFVLQQDCHASVGEFLSLVQAAEFYKKAYENAVATTQKWRGIFKLIEEQGELLTVLGKLGPFPDGVHPDGAGNLRPRLVDELSDVKAAIEYFEDANSLMRDHNRVHQKNERYRKWTLTGVTSNPDQK